VYRQLHLLEKDRERFLAQLEQQQETFREQRSLFGLSEEQKALRSIVHLIGMSVEFRGELLRRKQVYLSHYRHRRQELRQLAGNYQGELSRLAGLGEEISSREGDMPGYRAAFYLNETRRDYLARLIRALQN
jgi:hypothetical protein